MSAEVASLLARSRAAHTRSFQHRGRIDRDGRPISQPQLTHAGAAIADALSARLEAHALDPAHIDPAWLDDAAANKGVSHEALVAFFVRYLSPPDVQKAPPNAQVPQAGDSTVVH